MVAHTDETFGVMGGVFVKGASHWIGTHTAEPRSKE